MSVFKSGFWVAITAIVLSLYGCGGDSSSGPEGGSGSWALLQNTLDERRQQWHTLELTRYQYNYRRSCFCLDYRDVIISVQNGEITEAFYRKDGTYLDEETLDQLLTVDALFDEIQKAIDNRVYDLSVEYHSGLAYPTKISIDEDEQVVDEEITHYATDLQ